MARYLWCNWDGGGNLPPSLGVARALTARGHTVTFLGREQMVGRVQTAGFRTLVLERAAEHLARYPASPLRPIAAYLTSPAVGEEIASVVRAETPDAVLVDGMFPAALAEAAGFRRPTAVICHTFFYRLLDGWRAQLERLNGMRKQAGFDALPGLDDLWMKRDRIVVTTLRQFDSPPVSVPCRVHHAGPVFEDEERAKPAELRGPKRTPCRSSWSASAP